MSCFTLNAGSCQGSAKTGCFLGVQSFKSMDKVGGAIATQRHNRESRRCDG